MYLTSDGKTSFQQQTSQPAALQGCIEEAQSAQCDLARPGERLLVQYKAEDVSMQASSASTKLIAGSALPGLHQHYGSLHPPSDCEWRGRLV